MAARTLSFWLLCFEVMQVVSAEEFCNSEIFQPNCLHDEVIYIKKALYGRKEYGRCLKKEGDLDEDLLKKPGYINCSTEVKRFIERQCSGQQRCEVPVARIEADSGCSKAFKDYLDLKYSCKEGELVEF